MAKRFTDTEKWSKGFIRSLKAPYKLLWLYLTDACNHAGIWEVDIEVAQVKLGSKINVTESLNVLKSHVIAIDNGRKWFIPSFIEFQYGKLSETNRAHTAVIQQLLKYDLIDEYLKVKPLISPLQGAKDMDKEMDMDMDKEKGRGAGETFAETIIYPFNSEKFIDAWDVWKKYKLQQHRFTYKGTISEQVALKDLAKLANGDEARALELIEYAISKSWQGIFDKKENHNGKSTNNNQSNLSSYAADVERRLQGN